METRVSENRCLARKGAKKSPGVRATLTISFFPGMLHGATVRSPAPRGRIGEIRYEGDIPWNEFTIVTAQDIPGEKLRRAADRRSALPRRRIRQSLPKKPWSCSLTPINICSKKRAARCASKSSRCPRFFRSAIPWREKEDHLGPGQYFQNLPRGKRRRGQSLGQRRYHRRGRIRNRRAGTALHRAAGRNRASERRRRRNGLGLAAMPLLRAQSAGEVVRFTQGPHARDSDRNRRRFRRQRRISLDDRRACGAACAKIRQAR